MHEAFYYGQSATVLAPIKAGYDSVLFPLADLLNSPKKGVTVSNDLLVSNMELIPGRRIKSHLGLVQGSTVRAKHAGKDFLASLKNIVGGELKAYTELMQEARAEATERMTDQAASIGANGVLNVRYTTTAVTAGAAEILAYGTAVILE